MSDMQSSPDRDSALPSQLEERRRGSPSDFMETPRRRYHDSKFNQLKWPILVSAWFLAGLAIVALFLTT